MQASGYNFLRIAVYALGIFLMCGVPCLLHAQGLDPFEKDTTQWKAFDRYKEEEKARLFSSMTGNIEADSKAAKVEAEETENVLPATPKLAGDAGNEKITPPTLDASGIAAPERPLVPPVLPGVSSSETVQTAPADDDAKPAARIINVDSQPTLQFQKQNWLDAVRAAKESREEGHAPLNVRMSFLPGLSGPHKKSGAKVAAAAPPPSVFKQDVPKKSAADVAACAAIDAYKKRQLAAIQSDRETMAALQTAIKQLGLEKQLDFMNDQKGGVSTTADKSVLIDMPSTTAPAAQIGKP